jgi:hypothetical protein
MPNNDQSDNGQKAGSRPWWLLEDEMTRHLVLPPAAPAIVASKSYPRPEAVEEYQGEQLDTPIITTFDVSKSHLEHRCVGCNKPANFSVLVWRQHGDDVVPVKCMSCSTGGLCESAACNIACNKPLSPQSTKGIIASNGSTPQSGASPESKRDPYPTTFWSPTPEASLRKPRRQVLARDALEREIPLPGGFTE